MKKAWEGLTRKQQRTVVAGGGLLALIVLLFWLVVPALEAYSRAKISLAESERILQQLRPLSAAYGRGRGGEVQMKGLLASRSRDFNLLAYVEKRTDEAAIRPYVKSIQPAGTAPAGPYEETIVNVTLESVTLRQLLGFLHLVESQSDLVKTGHFSITRNREKAGYLNAAVRITSYGMPKNASTPIGATAR